jgi:putative ABC transport system permease protein
MRQLLAESLLIALLGAGLGIGLAFAGVAALGSLTPEGMARFHEVHVDHRVLLFTLGVSLLTGIAVGIAPALKAPAAVAVGIREGGRNAGDGRGRNRLRNALVVAEFALALGVLIGAGLLVSSLVRLQNVELGTTRDDVLVVRIALPASHYAEESSVGTFFDALIERVERLPGVGAAAVSMAVPPRRLVMTNPFTPEGRVYGAQDEPPVVQELLVSPAYFDVFGIPIGSGRAFSAADRDGAPLVAIVNAALAQQYFPGQDPVGRWLQLGSPSPDAPRWTIVGVAPDVHYSGLEHGDEPTVYVSYAQNLWWRSMYLVLRTSGDPLALVPSIRAQVAVLDPNVPLREVRTMDQLLEEAVAQPRFRTLLLGAFAGIALLLAAAGIYGVMSYTVNQRRREMSIRLALGARPSEIIRLVVGRGMVLAGVGVLLGLVVAASLSRLMQSMLFEVGALDVPTFAAAATFLALVALSACCIPAIRAGRVEAAAALRSE